MGSEEALQRGYRSTADVTHHDARLGSRLRGNDGVGVVGLVTELQESMASTSCEMSTAGLSAERGRR